MANSNLPIKLKDNSSSGRGRRGRIHPFVLGLVILCIGLAMQQWWWQLGAMILAVIFVNAVFKYGTLD